MSASTIVLPLRKPRLLVSGITIVFTLRYVTRCVEAKRALEAERERLEAMQAARPTQPTNTVAAPPPQIRIEMESVNRFLDDILREKPARFTAENLRAFTGNYAERLGSGGFGVVYRGTFPNGVQVAVKILNNTLDRRAKEQFMAEVGTTGRTYHLNLVRLFGFCLDATTKALVYVRNFYQLS